MIRILTFSALTLASFAAEPAADLLRLSNGELEGRFGGLSPAGVLRWERDDGIGPMEFKTGKVRQVVLRGGRPQVADAEQSHLILVNGDRLPARIVSADRESVTLETAIAGPLVVSRDVVSSIAPNPFGGRLIYAGPFSEKEWEIIDHGDPEVAEDESDGAAAPGWRHSGSKWYFTGGDQDALRLAAGMPDRATFKFKLEWRSRPPIAIAFHADFATPPAPENADDDDAPAPVRRRGSASLADSFGNAYVLTLRSSFAQLQQCGFNEDGEAFLNQVRSSSTNVRFDDTGEADFEIRCNRPDGLIALYINGEFAMQWKVGAGLDPADGYAGPGGGIGFQMIGGETPARVSDIIIAEWNGMPDSARSLESEDRDMVLLTNGTDRFSGDIRSIKEGMIELEGAYAELSVPLAEIAEIHFARSELRDFDDSLDPGVRVHFQPVGQIGGELISATKTDLKLRSKLLGELELDLSPAVILEFESGNSFLNYWDEDL